MRHPGREAGLMKGAVFIAAMAAALALTSIAGDAQARRYYGGGHHTTSHGGHYSGGRSGSSHKGGHYKNSRTSNRYGRHK
jgi:hypothetical protein